MLPSYKNKAQQLRDSHMLGKCSTFLLKILNGSLFTYTFEIDSHKFARVGLVLSIAQSVELTIILPQPPKQLDLQAEATRPF